MFLTLPPSHHKIILLLNVILFLFRGLGNDVDSRDSRYRMDKRDSLNDADMGLLLDPYGDLPNRGISRDALRDLPLSELAQKSSQKYKTGFELGRPFFGFSSDREEKEEGACTCRLMNILTIFVIGGLQCNAG